MAAVPSELTRRVHRLLAAATVTGTKSRRRALSVVASALLAAPLVLPTAMPAPAVPATRAALPAPLQAVADDIAALRAEFDGVRDLVLQLDLERDAAVAALLGQIEARLRRLETRLAGLARIALHSSVSESGPLGPAVPDAGVTFR